MPTFRYLKSVLRPWFKREDWSPRAPLPPEMKDVPPRSLIGPLFACLTEGGETARRAGRAMGGILAGLYKDSPEEARNIMRRFIWQMNEESGNVGWGIPEAFASPLAQSRPLADEYHSILFNYINNLEGDSIYCDYAPLRRSCYTAIGTVLEAWPDLSSRVYPLLAQAAIEEDDEECRRLAKSLLQRME